MSVTAQWKLRRLAPRALEVLARHMTSTSWMAVHAEGLGISAAAYMALYDQIRALGRFRKSRTGSKHSSAAVLLGELRGWAGVAAHAMPGMARGDFGASEVPDDIINDVIELIATVDVHEQKLGQTFAWSATMRTELEAALEAAKKEWGGAGGVAAELAAIRFEFDKAHSRFQADLVSFRAALEGLIGRSHPDYQMLRNSAVSREDEVQSDAVEATVEASTDEIAAV